MGLLAGADILLTHFDRQVLDVLVVGARAEAVGHLGVEYARQELGKNGIDNSGPLAQSIKSKVEYTPAGPLLTIYSDESMTLSKGAGGHMSPAPIALWVNSGVAGQIFPLTSKTFRFNPSRRGTVASARGVYNGPGGQFTSLYVYAPSVKGQKATHFMENAFLRIKATDFAVIP